jgi:hypothetical protein
MVTDKKPTKPLSKSAKKSTPKKSPQKILKLVSSGNQSQDMPPLSNLSFADMEPPDGFRVVSMSQALWDYGTPLMEMIPAPEDATKANEVFSTVTSIWNYTLNDTLKKKDRKSKADILALIHKELGLNQSEANDFFSMMVERKHFLFPGDIQPKGCPFLFKRKEVSYLINRFNYEDLKLNTDIIYANKIDLKVFKDLEKLDQRILNCATYDKYEKLFLKVQEAFPARFYAWLGNKGVEEYRDTFTYLSDVYISFIYGYTHEEPVTLKSGPGKYVVEFMVDFLLRKTSMEPWEYTLTPAAIRLFYKFLYEKLYLVDYPKKMTGLIDRLEPHFLEILKERFS